MRSIEPHDSDEIDLGKVLATLYAAKTSIALSVLGALIVALLIALYLPNKYTSETLLAPRDESGVSSLGQLANQYGGLASLAGINIGGLADSSRTAIAIETLRSRSFFRKYLYERIVVELMATERWISETNELVIDSDVYLAGEEEWVGEKNAGIQNMPSVQLAHKTFLERHMQVVEDKKTGLVNLYVTHRSPNVAMEWSLMLVEGVNQALRDRDVKEATNSIEFLNDQSEKTRVLSLNSVFAELIEQQMKTVMLANATDEYVFQIIDPPVAPEKKSSPSRTLIVLIGGLMGGILGCLLAIYSAYSSGKKSF